VEDFEGETNVSLLAFFQPRPLQRRIIETEISKKKSKRREVLR